jgi:diguanylate cyclase (GGDEF)-like protein
LANIIINPPARFKEKYLEDSVKHNFDFLFFGSLAMVIMEVFMIITAFWGQYGGAALARSGRFYSYEISLALSAAFFGAFLYIRQSERISNLAKMRIQQAFIITVLCLAALNAIIDLRNGDFNMLLMYVLLVGYLSTSVDMHFVFILTCIWGAFLVTLFGAPTAVISAEVVNCILSLLIITCIFTPVAILSHNYRIRNFIKIALSDEREQRVSMANQKINELMHRNNIAWIINKRSLNNDITDNIESEVEVLIDRHQKLYISMIQVEIDCFSEYIDFYGAGKGEACVISVSKGLFDSMNRDSDELFRYATGQFFLYMPSTNMAGAVKVANRIMDNVRSMKIPHESSHVANSITVSAGVVSCEFFDRKFDIEPILKYTGEVLEKAVKAGGNCFKTAEYYDNKTDNL